MRNERGETKFTTILLIVLLIVGGYVVVKIAPVYVRKFQIENLAKHAAKLAVDPAKRQNYRLAILQGVNENELPVAPEDFEVEVDEETHEATVYIEWETEVTFIPENGVIPPMVRTYSFQYEAFDAFKK